MFRKIVFIVFSSIPINIFVKSVVLLFLASFPMFNTLKCMPFVFHHHNILEFKADQATFINFFIGNLYLFGISENLKIACFCIIILANTRFILDFLCEIIILFLKQYIVKLFQRSSSFAKLLAKILRILERIKLKWNFDLLKSFFRGFKSISHKNSIKSKRKIKNFFHAKKSEIKA